MHRQEVAWAGSGVGLRSAPQTLQGRVRRLVGLLLNARQVTLGEKSDATPTHQWFPTSMRLTFIPNPILYVK